jgi:hypothetical protein
MWGIRDNNIYQYGGIIEEEGGGKEGERGGVGQYQGRGGEGYHGYADTLSQQAASTYQIDLDKVNNKNTEEVDLGDAVSFKNVWKRKRK